MRILLIEDNTDKISLISKLLSKNISDNHATTTIAKSLDKARREILKNSFDLIIFDIYLPLTCDTDSKVIDASSELIYEFSQSKNYQTETIAITKFDIDEIENISLFNQAGITVVHYSEDDLKWQESLELKIKKILTRTKYDFLIFCALAKERSAYANTSAILGDLKPIFNINCQDIKIGNYNGLCITPDKMGLVNMAISASKAIEAFQPKIVAMSGICAGFPGEANLLDLIIGDLCWEYQTGKFKNNEFKQEPYQSPLDHRIKVDLEQLCENQLIANNIKSGLFETELRTSEIFLGPISSGSAVIADEIKMTEIGMQHRKLAGLEMEMYSLYEAARQSLCNPLYFGAKAVVDLGDSSKADALHETASIISARFVIYYLLSKLPNLVK